MVQFGFVAQDIVEKGDLTWEDIGLIKKWLESRPDLPKYTDEQIASFHLACDKVEEETKKTIEAFHTIRCQTPHLFSKRNLEDPKVAKNLAVVNCSVFPERTPDGCVIFFTKLINTSYQSYDMIEHLKILLMVLDAAIHDYPSNGCILIVDMEGMGIMHSTRFKFNTIRSCANYLQFGLPSKLKNIHLLNSGYVVDKIVAMVRPFLTEHVANLILSHKKSDMDTFRFKYISSQYLPIELEGDLPSLEIIHQNTIEKLRSIQSHFDDEEKQRRGII